MQWSEICQAYPNKWLIIEAISAHTTPAHLRQLDKMAVVEQCTDGKNALLRYRCLHMEFPEREFYYVHTSRDELDIREKQWLGIRGCYAIAIEK